MSPQDQHSHCPLGSDFWGFNWWFLAPASWKAIPVPRWATGSCWALQVRSHGQGRMPRGWAGCSLVGWVTWVGTMNPHIHVFAPLQLAHLLSSGLLGMPGRPTAPRWTSRLSMSSSSTPWGEPATSLMNAACWSKTSSPSSWIDQIRVILGTSKCAWGCEGFSSHGGVYWACERSGKRS